MNPDWRTRIKEVYLAARGQKPEDRQRYLEKACGDDEEMRREVESMLLEGTQAAKLEDLSLEGETGDWLPPDRKASGTESSDSSRGPGPTASPAGPGDSIGRYRIVSLVGEGGMGKVYEAEDPELERRVALKVLPESLARDPKALERFKREARTVAALSHPNIVTLYSVEESEGTHFLTMELVRGEPLSRLIPEEGFDLKELLERAIPLADGLRAAHERGIVHRDLKPGNVMVDAEGRVRILDFGLAKLHTDLPGESQEAALTALTALGAIVGTVPYMSPEQVSGKPADQRSDIFSLGIILYEMCTGRRPFGGETATHTMSAILRDRPERVSEIRADLPEHLGRIVRRCLEKEPEKRYQSAQVVREELEELKREVESGPTMVHQGAGVASPPSRRRWIGLAASLAVVAAVAFLSFWPGRQDTEGPEELPGQAGSVTPDRKMIVVLPFENLGSSEDEYFAAGMTDEINSRLSKVSGLGVISRDSAIQYAETQKTTPQIGEELGVEYLLGGTVRWARSTDGGTRIRITPRLVRVADDTQLWSDSYDRVLDDVFDIQSDIAVQVVAQLGVSLLETEGSAIEERPTENLEAYEAFLRGSLPAGVDCEKQRERILHLDRAVELDPSLGVAVSTTGSADDMVPGF
jgi:serine/threonine protein kinase